MDIEWIEKLTVWFKKNARDLPWRHTVDPYCILVSEIMLQQTRVEAVCEKYKMFIQQFPDCKSLADASEDDLLKAWEGLGYYSRARNLQKTARIITDNYNNIFPSSPAALRSLPGIGPYTAAAVASISFSVPVTAVDGNLLRIFSRFHADPSDISKERTRKELACFLDSMIPAANPGLFNQALMDLGATVCIPGGAPHCSVCPLAFCCKAHMTGTENRFPVKAKLSPRKIERKTVFALSENGRFYGFKRPSTGLLASLYQLPEVSGFIPENEITDYISAHGFFTDGEILLYTRKHIFTHIEWNMHVCYATGHMIKDISNWILLDPECHSLPTAFQICLPAQKNRS